MEIKRRLTKIAKALSPQIESMNAGQEMNRLCDRFEELVNYCQEKIDRSAERKKAGLKPASAAVAEQRAADQKAITDHQEAEAAENLADQEEAKRERDARGNKSRKPKPNEHVAEDGTVKFDPDAVVPEGQVGLTDEQLNPKQKAAAKKKPVKKKKAKKKAKPVNKG